MPRSNKSWRMRRKSNSIVPPPQRKYLHHFPERLTATGRPVHSAIKAELHYTTIAATSQPKFGRRGAAAEVMRATCTLSVSAERGAAAVKHRGAAARSSFEVKQRRLLLMSTTGANVLSYQARLKIKVKAVAERTGAFTV